MRGIVAAVVLLTSFPALAEGPERDIVDLKAAVLVPLEGQPKTVKGGVWFSDEETIRIAGRLAACSANGTTEAQEALQKALLEPPKEGGSWVLPTAIGLSIGLLGGFLWGSLSK